jgi:hypothetical protein
MGSRSQQKFSQQFVWNSMLEKTEAAYASALPSVVTQEYQAPLGTARIRM